MSTKKEKIISKIIELLKSNSDGYHYSELLKKLKQEFPDYPQGTIHGTLWQMDALAPNEVYKPARGLFRHTSFREKEITATEREVPTVEKTREESFYKPFADWLVKDLEECTKAIPLGGTKFRDKWGTPDVIGILESSRSDLIKPPTEVVSAEIKTDSSSLITAFEQACAYKLFSHKSYLVIPKNSLQSDISKIDALCLIFGIGLVLFDNNNADDPKFEIRVRPSKHEPDMFYTNNYLKMIENELFA